LEVIPFAVEYNTKDQKVKNISNVRVYDPIDLTKEPKLQSEIREVDNYLNSESKVVSMQEIEDVVSDIREYISESRAKSSTAGIKPDTLSKLIELIEQLSNLVDILDSIKDDNIKLADEVYINGLYTQRDELVKELNYQM